jgi:D-alanine-D-alanine ligase
MKIALLYNARPDCVTTPFPDDAFEEYDSDETITGIANALCALGVTVEPVLADRSLPWRLEEGQYDFAFNIAEGEGRRCREAIPAAVCELLGVPFTGSDALTLAMTLDKAIARRVVSPEVPVARGVLVARAEDEASLETLRYPVLVKPNDEGSSKGIRENPVALDITGALAQCRWLRAHYACPVLVEEFLPGTEVTVGIVGNGPETRVLGMMEIAPVSEEQFFVYSLEVKRNWRQRVRYYIPPRLPAAVLSLLERNALTAYRLLGCRDCARLDFRLNAASQPCFVECNPLPGLNPTHSDLVILSREVLAYEKLVQGILLDATRRVGRRLP